MIADKILYHPEGWLPGEDLPAKILELGFKKPVGIEIGTDQGTTTEYLLRSIPDLRLFGVDDYSENRTLDVQSQTFELYMSKVAPYADRFVHYKKTSDNAVDEFKKESIDFIFVDGDHRYAQVLKDCQNYYPKLKKGGLFSGHDWSLPEVKQAVTEFAAQLEKPVSVMKQDVWYWIK